MKFSVLGIFLIFFSIFFSKISFFELKWYFCDQKFNITIVLSLNFWKLHFWGFPEIQKRNFHFVIFILWKKWIFYFFLDHFDGPQLFVCDRTSLENARNGVFRSSRYCLKKIPSKNFQFWQSYSKNKICFFFVRDLVMELLQIGIFKIFVAAKTPKKYQGALKLLFLDGNFFGFMQIPSLSSELEDVKEPRQAGGVPLSDFCSV